MASPQPSAYIALARSLPPRLKTFFARYPPGAIVAPPPPSAPPSSASVSMEASSIMKESRSPSPLEAAYSATAPSREGTSITTKHPKGDPIPPQQQQETAAEAPLHSRKNILEKGAQPPSEPLTLYQKDRPNPFLPYRNPATGKWQDPVYSMRRQAELVKLARGCGVEELLPPTRKGTSNRVARRVALGLRVKGTGVGQKVKGHKFERIAEDKMEKKRAAVEGMYSMVKEWKSVGAYRWNKFPK